MSKYSFNSGAGRKAERERMDFINNVHTGILDTTPIILEPNIYAKLLEVEAAFLLPKTFMQLNTLQNVPEMLQSAVLLPCIWHMCCYLSSSKAPVAE